MLAHGLTIPSFGSCLAPSPSVHRHVPVYFHLRHLLAVCSLFRIRWRLRSAQFRGRFRSATAYVPQAGATYAAEFFGSFLRFVPSVRSFGRFLLPGGRPRRLICDIQAGGRPRRLPRRRANFSKIIIASSSCSRSTFNSASILLMSIHLLPKTLTTRSSSGSEKSTKVSIL